MLRGRNLSVSDATNAPLVCLVDARFAARFFPGQDPIGQEITMYGGWVRIVGVTGALRGTTLQEGSRPVACYSLPQVPVFPHAAIVARSDAPAAGVIRAAPGARPGQILSHFPRRGLRSGIPGLAAGFAAAAYAGEAIRCRGLPGRKSRGLVAAVAGGVVARPARRAPGWNNLSPLLEKQACKFS